MPSSKEDVGSPPLALDSGRIARRSGFGGILTRDLGAIGSIDRDNSQGAPPPPSVTTKKLTLHSSKRQSPYRHVDREAGV